MLAMLLIWAWPGLASSQQLPLRYLTQQDGLGSLAVNTLAQDRAGYLWVGTDNGLFRYNGSRFQRYAQPEGLMNTEIMALLADRGGRLWIATPDGLYLRRGERLLPVQANGQDLSLTMGQVLADGPQNSLMMVSEQQLLQVREENRGITVRSFFSAAQRRQYPMLEKIWAVMAEQDGELWMGCGQALCTAGTRGVTVLGTAAGVPSDHWLNLWRSADGTLWGRGERHVIVQLPGGNRFIDRTPPGDVMRKATMSTTLVEDGDHRMLTNTDQGLARWRAGRWELFGAANGLKMGGGVVAMLVDRDHGLWLGTGGHGLVRWMGYDNWENWGITQGLADDNVFAFLRDGRGRLRIGTRSGMSMLRDSGATRAVPVPGYPQEQWSSMALDRQGALWSSSYVGTLMREDGVSGAARQVAKLPMIFKLLVDRQGRLWISTSGGLYVIEKTAAGAVPRHPPGLPEQADLATDGTRRSCESPDGTLWFLTADYLWRLRGQRWESYGTRRAREPEFDMLACSSDGTLWLGQGSGGLWHARVGDHGLVKEAQPSPLLHDKVLLTIHEDRHGWLWLGTDAGLVLWDRSQWRQFDSSDGLVWNDLNARPFYEEADGTIWLATTNGTSHVIRPDRLFAPYPMSAIVEGAERDGRMLSLHDDGALPWSSGGLQLTLASLSYQHRDALRFRYRLMGLEQEWSVTAAPTVRYSALPPGEYRFQYAVINRDMQSESPPAELRFTILPPWWLSRWFLALCVIAALGLLLLLHRYRVRGLQARNAQMECLVQARTSELQARTRELELSQEALRERALRDGLTKAWNRVAMLEMMDQAILKAQRDAAAFLLCLLDLDHFKRINDTYGHLAGDAVLRGLVQRLNGCVRPYDLVGRYGGEEFLVLLADLDQADGAPRVEAMRHAIEATPFDLGEQGMLAVTSSFGVAVFNPAQPVSGLELIRAADQALYQAKALGRNRIEFAV